MEICVCAFSHCVEEVRRDKCQDRKTIDHPELLCDRDLVFDITRMQIHCSQTCLFHNKQHYYHRHFGSV